MEALIKVVPHVSAVNMCKHKIIETITYQLLPSGLLISQMEVTYLLKRSLKPPFKRSRTEEPGENRQWVEPTGAIPFSSSMLMVRPCHWERNGLSHLSSLEEEELCRIHGIVNG